MNAVSSFRPLAQSVEIARNQFRAKASWNRAFDHILYFGETEPLLSSPTTEFVPSEQFPTIDRMLMAASLGVGWTALLNADIVVDARLRSVVGECQARGIMAITSMRFQFDGEDLAAAKVVDSGYDFFMTDPSIWREAAKVCPAGYRIGHQRWDNWILGYLRLTCGKRFVDVTSRRLIFHPNHASRSMPHQIVVEKDRFLKEGIPPYYRLP